MGTIVLLRHGPKGSDGELTLEGKIFCREVGKKLMNEHGQFSWAVSSPEKRAVETARILTMGYCPIQKAKEVGIPEKEMATVLELFGKRGNAPLVNYFAEGDEVKQKFDDYGNEGWGIIAKASIGRDPVLVVGHEVLLPAIAAAATNRGNIAMTKTFKPCEGLILSVDENNRVTAVQMFKPY
ncbi:MAG: histidine phosphatase family protein [Candidatus Paceibacterota bacterium]|jgi:broad specificity phosphatase PhoE